LIFRATTVRNRCLDQGDTNVVKLLLDKSADVNSVNNETESCLFRAATNGYINVVSRPILMFAGADVNIRPNDGCSLLHVVSLGGCIDLLNVLLTSACTCLSL